MRFIAIAIVTALLVVVNGQRQRFHGYQVIRTQATTKEQVDSLHALEHQGGYDFWMEPKFIGGYADIMLPPQDWKVKRMLQHLGMEYTVLVDDVDSLVENERSRLATRQSKNMTWDEYQTLETVYAWLDELVASHSDLLSIETYGKSTEGRDLKILKISTGGSTRKPAFWIDATIHAREWVATTTATYIINQLVNNQANYTDILNLIDFYIVPIVNPDGYQFTFDQNRMWRKTRSNYNNYTGNCIGVDNNRNFGFKYGDDDGSSSNPCTETYRGPEAYSEPEAEAIKNYVVNRANLTKWTAFITLHSYSQLWMTPYGYSATELPADFPELKGLSDVAVAALKATHGMTYLTGNAAQILYPSSGSSRDWAKGEGGFKFVYTIELRDEGRYGFILPPDQIIPTAEETWAGIQVVARYLPTL